jgi:hypothetical protein
MPQLPTTERESPSDASLAGEESVINDRCMRSSLHGIIQLAHRRIVPYTVGYTYALLFAASDLSFKAGFGVGTGTVAGAALLVVLLILFVKRYGFLQLGNCCKKFGQSQFNPLRSVSLPNVRASVATASITTPLANCGSSKSDSVSYFLSDSEQNRGKLTIPVEVIRKRSSTQSSADDVFKSPDHGSTCSLDVSGKASPLGSVHFALRFDSSTSELSVHIISASDLPANAITGVCNPYVLVSLMPDRTSFQETAFCTETTSPDFNEMFLFRVMSATDLSSKFLYIRVASYEQQNVCRVLGELEHQLNGIDVISGSYCLFKRPLQPAGLHCLDVKV